MESTACLSNVSTLLLLPFLILQQHILIWAQGVGELAWPDVSRLRAHGLYIYSFLLRSLFTAS